jgi:hypothetical protein
VSDLLKYFRAPVDQIYAFNSLVQAINEDRVRLDAAAASTAGSLFIDDGEVLSNISGASATAIGNTVTALLDHVLGSTQGDILYRGASTWATLAPGTSGKSLLTGGAGGNPSWAYPDAGTLLGTTLASNVVTSSLTAVGTIATGVWHGTKIGLAYGGTNADLSATGGTSQVLMQVTAGAAVTVAQLAASNLSNGTTGSGAVVLAGSPALTGSPTAPTQTPGDNSTKIATTAYVDATGTGTVSTVSVVTANGFAGSVANPTTTPAITLTTTITGILQGNGTAISAASTTGSGAVVLAGSPTLTSTPLAPTAASGTNTTQIATTAFVTTAVNNAIAGVNPAVAVQAATTAAANTSGFTYNNGVSGIGASFTGAVNTAVVIDGYTFTALGQRLLVKNDTQSPSGAFNGVYYVTQVQTAILPPILTRALDYDMPSDINNTGAIPVVNGTVNALTSWLLTSTVTAVGTDPLTYTEFSRNPADYFLISNNLSEGTAATMRTNLGLGTMATQAASAVAVTGGTLTGLTGLAIRDTSAAFDVTLAATSGTALTADRALTFNMGNVAHTLTFGTTANTITFPSSASYTVAGRGLTQSFTGTNTFTQQIISSLATGTAPFSIASTTRVANLNVATAGAADTVTTNADLTGPITSVGNATSIASQTGTGTKFVVDTSPTLVTPVLGVATATSITLTGTGGAGYINLPLQVSPPTGLGTTVRVWSGGTTLQFAYNDGTGAVRLDNSLLTAARLFQFPDVAGTLITTGDTGTVTNTMLAGSIANAKLVNSSLTVGGTNIALGATSTTLAGLTSVTATGGSLTGLTGLAIRDTSAAFDVTLAATASTALTAGRTLTLDMKNVAHTLAFGSTANTITFPSAASYTLIGSGDTGTVIDAMLGLTTPALGTPSAIVLTNATGTAASLTAGKVTTNANLTGPVTSVGNATSITSGLTLTDPVMSDYKTCTAQLDKTSSTTYAGITGLSIALTAGATYIIQGWLSTTSGAAGGLKVKLFASGGLTATSIRAVAIAWNSTTVVSNVAATTSLGANLVATNAVITDVYISGSIVVNVAGSMVVQAAQNTSDGTTTSVFANSNFSCTRVA